MVNCVAIGCKNNSSGETKPINISFHSFPSSQVKRNQWLIKLRRKNFIPSNYSVLCSDHFQDEYFDTTGKTVRLRNDAIPTIFKNFSKSYSKEDSSITAIDTNGILKNSSSLKVTGITSIPKTTHAMNIITSVAKQSHNGNTKINESIHAALQTVPVQAKRLKSDYTTIKKVFSGEVKDKLKIPQYANQRQQCYGSLGNKQEESYVIEAPSFIVPFILERKPKETIKHYLETLKNYEDERKEVNDSENGNLCRPDNMEECEHEDKAERKKDKLSTHNGLSDKGKITETEDKYEKGDKREVKKKDRQDIEPNNIPVPKKEDEDYKPDSDSSDNEENNMQSDDSMDDSDKENDIDVPDDLIVFDSTKMATDDLSHLGQWEPFYRSSLGKFIMEIGLNQVQQYIQCDIVGMTKRKLNKMKENPTKQELASLKSLENQLKISRDKNSHFNMELKKCKQCSFKSDSVLVMNKHLEVPHMINYNFRCNICEFGTKVSQLILCHMEDTHHVKGRLEKMPASFQCPLCPFEEESRNKLTRHSVTCIKRFRAEKNCELSDWEPPAKILKLKHVRMNTANRSYKSQKMPVLSSKVTASVSQNMLASVEESVIKRGRRVSASNNVQFSNRTAETIIFPASGATRFLNSYTGANAAQQLSIAKQIMQSVTNSVGRKLPQLPSISVKPLVIGGQQNTPETTKKDDGPPAFVICEICDGYITDLEQLSNHINLIHKIKINSKMMCKRRPLNCQKCQSRFFTDQGLERHLLGTHGLVTSSMQEAASQGKDAGRCLICRKVYPFKLLKHMTMEHKLTLQPAHLSYKCTVCTEKFKMYCLFEKHVQSVHSSMKKNKLGISGSNSK